MNNSASREFGQLSTRLLELN